MWFDDLSIEDRKFVSWAPCVRKARSTWGILKLREFEEWKNESLVAIYETEKKNWLASGKELNEKLLYHGCPTLQGRESIKRDGFSLGPLGSSSGNMGLFGAGIYFGTKPTVSIGYSTTVQQNDALPDYSIIVSKVMVGKTLELPWGGVTNNKERECAAGIPMQLLAFPFTGIGKIDGYDSHGCGGREICIFNPSQILPIGMLHMNVIPFERAKPTNI